jgi:hypothetical protein
LYLRILNAHFEVDQAIISLAGLPSANAAGSSSADIPRSHR